ncbi:DUF1697 domain-containing protein [Parapusillimonas sp. SGNA-6]|uniref:DUF1697 domain-containing protein n=1 Tax=Parapedobacter sp. SGR-10 TaxID=2710879 RepID=UPI0013D7A32B|nr:DUF1697 domain-containing protein [Parapedobacter sp. SGR-10]NGF56882.1 DUF1697 domain-containing protein [Parapedobacter sp. SGR-10]NGM89881.1 DUF1697 domain-containing protein [Parapusillimonas sp. SGNA-6]
MKNKYVIFLRAVNVSGKNIIKMAELRDLLSKQGFEQAKTYIQSGNICLSSDKDKDTIKQEIHELIANHFKLHIDVFVLDEAQLHQSILQNPFDPSLPGNRLFVTFLDSIPDSTRLEAFHKIDLGNEEIKISGDIAYFYVPDGMATSKLSNIFIEQKLKVRSTGRNMNTMKKMQDMLQQNILEKS